MICDALEKGCRKFIMGIGGSATNNGGAEIQIVIRENGLEMYIRDADVVITGEGRLDEQTAMAKAPAGVARLGESTGYVPYRRLWRRKMPKGTCRTQWSRSFV